MKSKKKVDEKIFIIIFLIMLVSVIIAGIIDGMQKVHLRKICKENYYETYSDFNDDYVVCVRERKFYEGKGIPEITDDGNIKKEYGVFSK